MWPITTVTAFMLPLMFREQFTKVEDVRVMVFNGVIMPALPLMRKEELTGAGDLAVLWMCRVNPYYCSSRKEIMLPPEMRY
jgi:hypothetical protein